MDRGRLVYPRLFQRLLIRRPKKAAIEMIFAFRDKDNSGKLENARACGGSTSTMGWAMIPLLRWPPNGARSEALHRQPGINKP